MPKAGEIPLALKIHHNLRDLAVVLDPDGRPHYMPREILVSGFPKTEKFTVSSENGATVAKSAQVDPTTTVGARVFVGPGTTMGGEGDIGDDAKIGRDGTIGTGVTIEPHAILGSRVAVGDGSRIEERAAVFPDVTIGQNSVVGSNADVLEYVNIADGSHVHAGNIVPTGTRVEGEFGTEGTHRGRRRTPPKLT